MILDKNKSSKEWFTIIIDNREHSMLHNKEENSNSFMRKKMVEDIWKSCYIVQAGALAPNQSAQIKIRADEIKI